MFAIHRSAVLVMASILAVSGLLPSCNPSIAVDSDADTTDGGDADVDEDGDADANVVPTSRASTFITAGGGQTRSAGHTLRLSIGAPQPAGAAESAGSAVTLGPAGARP